MQRRPEERLIMMPSPIPRVRPGARSSFRTGLLAVGAVALLPSTAAPQVLRGVVVDDETRSPLPAALIVLVDDAGRERQRFLADRSGSFRFDLPGPGTYALRVERLGAETRRLDGLRIGGADTLTVRVAMTARPVALEGIEVGGESRCELARNAGARTQRVWEEARKALTTASLADSLATYRYSLVRYSRELDPRTLAVRRSTESRESIWSRRPIVSRPMEVLADSGFVIADAREGDRYYAPDADALLSDRFLNTHCFGVRAGTGDEEEDLIGLEFRPVGGGPRLADIEGVLWLDREDGGLRWLEFRYTDLPGPAGDVRSGAVGGRVEFREIPDGGWIISRWYIRMPVAQMVRAPLIGARLRLVAIAEEGGRVVRARRPDAGGVVFAEGAGTIAGELAREGWSDPRTDGSVRVIGTGARSEVDARGRFRIDGVAEGRYRLAYTRPELLGLDGAYPVADVEVAGKDTSRVTIEPPPEEEVLASVCGVDRWHPDAAVLIGEVADAATGVAATDVEVSAVWQTYATADLERGRFDGVERTEAGWTDGRGAFRICGVPTGTTLTVTAELGGGGSYERPVLIPEGQPVAFVVLDGAAATPPAAELRRSHGEVGTTGRLVGRVILSVEAIAAEPIEVTVERREVALELAGFYERMDEGWGRFLHLDEIERRNPGEMTDLFSGMRGVSLVGDCLNPLERYVVLRGGRGGGGCHPSAGRCYPAVVLDGTVVHQAGSDPARVDHLIESAAVAGIEVYPSSIGVPVQYTGTGSSCGVILIWTRR